MRKTILLAPLMMASLAACTPQSYQVNPQPDASSDSNQVPESQSKDYMRIIGDLRWDKLTSPEDWKTRFPGCLVQKTGSYTSSDHPILYPNDYDHIKNANEMNDYDQYPNPKCGLSIGGLSFYVRRVDLEKDPTGQRPFRTSYINLQMPREDQYRAFKSVMAGKYSSTDSGRCSKYTCFVFNLGVAIGPTPYTTSILDSVKVDPSAF